MIVSVYPEDFLKLAKELTNNTFNCPDEIISRTVVNRAYYSAFLSARIAAKITSTSGSVHGDVIDYFKGKKKTGVSNRLDSMKILRQKADYRPNESLTPQEAQNCCRQANRVISALALEPDNSSN